MACSYTQGHKEDSWEPLYFIFTFFCKQVGKRKLFGELDVSWDRICRYEITLCLTEGNGMKLFGFPCSVSMFYILTCLRA